MRTLHTQTPPESSRRAEPHRVGEVVAITDEHGQLELFWIARSPRKGKRRLHAIRFSPADTAAIREALNDQ